MRYQHGCEQEGQEAYAALKDVLLCLLEDGAGDAAALLCVEQHRPELCHELRCTAASARAELVRRESVPARLAPMKPVMLICILRGSGDFSSSRFSTKFTSTSSSTPFISLHHAHSPRVQGKERGKEERGKKEEEKKTRRRACATHISARWPEAYHHDGRDWVGELFLAPK